MRFYVFFPAYFTYAYNQYPIPNTYFLPNPQSGICVNNMAVYSCAPQYNADSQQEEQQHHQDYYFNYNNYINVSDCQLLEVYWLNDNNQPYIHWALGMDGQPVVYYYSYYPDGYLQYLTAYNQYGQWLMEWGYQYVVQQNASSAPQLSSMYHNIGNILVSCTQYTYFRQSANYNKPQIATIQTTNSQNPQQINTETFVYSHNGGRATATLTNQDGQLLNRQEITYNKQGKIIRKTGTTGPIQTYTYTPFDSLQQKLLRSSFRGDTLYHELHTYNKAQVVTNSSQLKTNPAGYNYKNKGLPPANYEKNFYHYYYDGFGLIRMLWPELNEAQNQPPALIYTWTLR